MGLSAFPVRPSGAAARCGCRWSWESFRAQRPEQHERSPAGPPRLPSRTAVVGVVAVEADRAASGARATGSSAGSRVWLGLQLVELEVTIWVDETKLHGLHEARWINTLPSRLGVADLAGGRWRGMLFPRSSLAGTRGCRWRWKPRSTPLAWPPARAQSTVGDQLAGQRVIVRMDRPRRRRPPATVWWRHHAPPRSRPGPAPAGVGLEHRVPRSSCSMNGPSVTPPARTVLAVAGGASWCPPSTSLPEPPPPFSYQAPISAYHAGLPPRTCSGPPRYPEAT